MDSLLLQVNVLVAMALLSGGTCVLLIFRNRKQLRLLAEQKDKEIKNLRCQLDVQEDLNGKLRESKRSQERMYKSKLDYFYNFINYNRLGVASHSEKELALTVADSESVLTLAEIYKIHQEGDSR